MVEKRAILPATHFRLIVTTFSSRVLGFLGCYNLQCLVTGHCIGLHFTALDSSGLFKTRQIMFTQAPPRCPQVKVKLVYTMVTGQWTLGCGQWWLCNPVSTIHCQLSIVHCTLYTVHCLLFTVYCTLYTVYCTLYTVHCPLYAVHCTPVSTVHQPNGATPASTAPHSRLRRKPIIVPWQKSCSHAVAVAVKF